MATEPAPFYPDNDQPLEDKRLLLNAISFATGQSAFEAETIVRLPLDALDEQHLAYLTVQAFSVEMLATEDFVGWHSVLRDWQPGSPDRSLAFLLDRVNVNAELETELASKLEQMNADEYRAMIHVRADDSDLLRAGIPADQLPLIPIAVSAQLDGARRMIAHRREGGRGRVIGYNKAKHVFVGLHQPEVPQVLVPARFKIQRDGVHIQTVTLEVSPRNVRQMTGRAIATMATLNATLGLTTWSRFGVPYKPPLWARTAAKLPIWTSQS